MYVYKVYDEHPRLSRLPEQRLVLVATRKREALRSLRNGTYFTCYVYDREGNLVGRLTRDGDIFALEPGEVPGYPYRHL